MQQIDSLRRSIRAFWASHNHRKRVVWVLAVAGLVGIVLGVYTIIAGQRDYARLSDELADIETRRDAFTQLFPVSEVDGEMVPDLSEATQTDLMFIAMLKRDENVVIGERIDADNERRQGIRFIGYSVIVLALAYFFLPENKSQPMPDDPVESGAPEEEPPEPRA
jgi:hypothetical protein